ncbi:MAG: DUF4147 domain-containing protein [Candidatus Thermoplasmatota archaeon]|nr:DUF4147 domain-containing protein [Candidatus Thermoplasmatota archaeon]
MKKLSPYEIVRNNVWVHEHGLEMDCCVKGERIIIAHDLQNCRVFTLSVGKASAPMHSSMKDMLDRLDLELPPFHMVIGTSCENMDARDILMLKGHHPLPMPDDTKNVRRIRDVLSYAGPDDIVIVMVSGGASSLLFSPREGLDPLVKIDVVRQLILSGANIIELNTVRTYLSDVKGGGLLSSINEARIVTLMISDVPGNDPAFIGSGPTIPRSPSRDSVMDILERFHIDQKTVNIIGSLDERHVPEYEGEADWVMIADNMFVLRTASDLLSKREYDVIIDPIPFSGEARTTSIDLIRKSRVHLSNRRSAFIAQGETVVHVTGEGRGGRNLEMALSSLDEIKEGETALFLSTDGSDGTSDLAGACIEYEMVRDDAFAMNCLKDSDSASYFERHPGGIRTGPTQTNLGDLFVLLSHPPKGKYDHLHHNECSG